MPQPVPFIRKYDLTNQDGLDLRTQLDVELDDVARCFLETLTNLALIQRDDGQIANDSIGVEQLKAELIAGFNPPEPYQPYRPYVTNDSFVTDDGRWFIVVNAYTSTTNPDDNLSDLSLVYDFSFATQEAVDARDAAQLAQAAAEQARDKSLAWAETAEDVEVETGKYSSLHHAAKSSASAAAAATSESNAATSASNASTSATNAAASESNAATSATNAANSASAASTSETNAAATLADFRSRFYGAYASDPAADPNGDLPTVGDLYWNTASDRLRTFDGTAWQDTTLTGAVLYTSLTGAAIIPSGTTAERDASPGTNKLLRFNTDTGLYEGYNGSEWVAVGSGAKGGGGNQIFVENDQVITADYTIPSNKNASSTGPLTLADGVKVTIGDGARWVIH